MPTPSGLDHVALHVTDPDAAADWCVRVLGLIDAFPGRWEGVPRMMLSPQGREQSLGMGLGTGIALFPKSEVPKSELPKTGGRAAGASSGEREGPLSHIAFRCGRDELDAWRSHLASLEIRVTEEDHEVSQSIYFRGPDDVLFEITAYE